MQMAKNASHAFNKKINVYRFHKFYKREETNAFTGYLAD